MTTTTNRVNIEQSALEDGMAEFCKNRLFTILQEGIIFLYFSPKGDREAKIRVPITRYLSSQLHWADPLNGGGLTRYLKKIIAFNFPSFKQVIVDVTLCFL